MLLACESAKPWLNYGLSEGMRMIREAGFDAVDLSYYWQAAPVFLSDDYEERAAEIREEIRKNGLVCRQAHAPFDLKYDMEQSMDTFEYASIVRAIRSAGIIGIDHIVVHGITVPAPAASCLNMETNYAFYKKLEPECEKAGVRIAVENLSGSFTYPDLLNEILRKLDSPFFTGLLDIGHAWLRAGIQPGQFLRQMDPSVITGLHVHDNHGPECHVDEHLLPFAGTIDFEDFLKALREYGYDGDFTMECVRYLDQYAEQGLLGEALKLEEAVGRKLIGRI